MKSFIIIEHEPLTERLNRIWNIEELLSKGINVEYWDVSQLIYNGIDIPGLLYEPMKIEQKSSQTKVRRKNKLF